MVIFHSKLLVYQRGNTSILATFFGALVNPLAEPGKARLAPGDPGVPGFGDQWRIETSDWNQWKSFGIELPKNRDSK